MQIGQVNACHAATKGSPRATPNHVGHPIAQMQKRQTHVSTVLCLRVHPTTSETCRCSIVPLPGFKLSIIAPPFGLLTKRRLFAPPVVNPLRFHASHWERPPVPKLDIIRGERYARPASLIGGGERRRPQPRGEGEESACSSLSVSLCLSCFSAAISVPNKSKPARDEIG